MCPIDLLSNGIPDAISNSNSNTISVTISAEIRESISDYITASNHSHCSTLLQEGGLRQRLCEAVGKHLSSWYITQVDLFICSHGCRKMVFCRNVCKCSSAGDSVLDSHNQLG